MQHTGGVTYVHESMFREAEKSPASPYTSPIICQRWWSRHILQCSLLSILLLLLFIIISGVRLSPLGTAATTGLLYHPQTIDDGDCGAIREMKIGRGNWAARRKPAPVPLCPPQIPHDLTRARARAEAVGSQRPTACAMARSLQCSLDAFNLSEFNHTRWPKRKYILYYKNTNLNSTGESARRATQWP
jgi:hypothetical protein